MRRIIVTNVRTYEVDVDETLTADAAHEQAVYIAKSGFVPETFDDWCSNSEDAIIQRVLRLVTDEEIE